jgi:hypothetical protein
MESTAVIRLRKRLYSTSFLTLGSLTANCSSWDRLTDFDPNCGLRPKCCSTIAVSSVPESTSNGFPSRLHTSRLRATALSNNFALTRHSRNQTGVAT